MKISHYMLGIYGTNTYLAYDDDSKDCFIVDPAAPSASLKAEIREKNLNPEYIILTHGHGDHTGGIDDLRKSYPDIKLVASREERDFLYDRYRSMGKGGYRADVEVSDGDELCVGSMKLKFLLTPGHTPGGMCILAGKVLFSGDTLFYASIGRTDMAGGDFDALIRSIKEKLLVLPDDTEVFPGHMSPTTIGFEKRYNPFV